MPSLDLAGRFGGLPRPFWWLWAGMVLNRAGQFVQPLLTFYLVRDRGFELSTAAAMVALWGVGSTLGALLGGVLADRLGRRPTLLASALGTAAMLQALALAGSPAEVGLAVAGLALVYDMHRPAVFAMVADVVPALDRARAYALLYVAVNLGFACAPALAGWLAGTGYALVFGGAAGMQLVWAAWVAVALPETAPTSAGAPASPGLGAALADRTYLRFLAVSTLLTLLPHQSNVALAAWMGEQGHSPATFGTVISLNGVLIVAVQPWVAGTVGRWDGPRTYALAALLYGVGFALHGQGSAVALHAAAVAVWTLGEILASPVNSSVVATLAPEEARGRYQGLMGTSFALAGVGAPLFGAWVMETAGGGAVWWACLGIGFVVMLAITALGPSLRSRMGERPSEGPASARRSDDRRAGAKEARPEPTIGS